jgi:hypothetical protein
MFGLLWTSVKELLFLDTPQCKSRMQRQVTQYIAVGYTEVLAEETSYRHFYVSIYRLLCG